MLKFVFVILLLVVCINATHNYKKPHNLHQNTKRHIVQPSLDKAFYHKISARNGNADPAVNRKNALTARKLVSKIKWASLATISRLSDWTGYPFANVKSIADGTTNNSTGIPYFYLTPLDDSVQDIEQENHVSITMSIEQLDGYCKSKKLNAEDNGCIRINMLGQMVKLEEGSDEQKFAKKALFQRHPTMKYWPADGNYFFAKLEIRDVVVLFDSIHHECVPRDVYFETNPYENESSE